MARARGDRAIVPGQQGGCGTHSGCDSSHKICASSRQTKCQQGSGVRGEVGDSN